MYVTNSKVYSIIGSVLVLNILSLRDKTYSLVTNDVCKSSIRNGQSSQLSVFSWTTLFAHNWHAVQR